MECHGVHSSDIWCIIAGDMILIININNDASVVESNNRV